MGDAWRELPSRRAGGAGLRGGHAVSPEVSGPPSHPLLLAACLALASALSAQPPDRAALEAVAREALADRAGAVLVLNVETGQVLACSDPRRAFERPYPPGSAFKPVTAAAALETRLTDARARIECRPRMTAHESFLCTIPQGHGRLAIVDALAQSCNVHFQELGRRLSAKGLHEWARRFGFGEPTGLAPPGCVEASGALPTPSSALQRAKQAIGQGGITATPAQVAFAYRRLALGRTPQGPLCSRETLDLLRRGLRQAVTDGTARRAEPSNVTVAGKTGTPEVDPSGVARHAWFIGYAPAERPRVVIVVFLERGSGGLHAAPIARTILRRYFRDD